MNNILKNIIAYKTQEALVLQGTEFLHQLRTIKSLQKALSQNNALIAEIKRASPAKGDLSDILDPVALAKQYQQAGACAISVLTEERYFKGSLHDLRAVSTALKHAPCPILRKDFIVDKIHIDQAYQAGADAILLIVAVLEKRTQDLLQYAHSLGLDVLVEVHTQDELTQALSTDARIIGINNRNLKTLAVDIQTSFDMIKHIPDSIITVSESGIHDANTARRLFDAGFNGLLIGEALVRSNNPGEIIHAMRH